MGVRFAHEFHGEAEQAVAQQEQPRDGHQRPGPCAEPPEDNEQAQPFQECLVELRRVPGQRARAGEYHSPGHIRRFPPQFRIDKIPYASGKQAHGHRRRQEIDDFEELLADSAAVQPASDEYPDQPAVKRHAALPDLEHVQGIAEVVRQVVEQHRTQPATDDNSEDAVKHEVRDLFGGPAEAPGFHPVMQQRPGAEDADDIADAVPADLQEPQVDGNGVNVREGQHTCSI